MNVRDSVVGVGPTFTTPICGYDFLRVSRCVTCLHLFPTVAFVLRSLHVYGGARFVDLYMITPC